MKSIPVLFGCLLLTFGAGFFLGKEGEQKPAAESSSATPSIRPRPTKSSQQFTDKLGVDEISIGIKSILSARSGSSTKLVYQLALDLSSSNLEELEVALTEIQAQGGREHWSEKRMLMRAVFERYAELGSSEALQRAQKVESNFKSVALDAVFGKMAEKDPEKAWRAATEEFTPGLNQQRARQAALNAISKQNPELAHAKFLNSDDLDANTIFSNWAKKDPASAFQAAQSLKGTSKDNIVASIITQWFEEEPETALQRLTSLPETLQRNATNSLLNKWILSDSSAAAQWASQNLNLINPRHLSFIDTWAKKDASAALTWTQENLTGYKKSLAMRQVFQGWYQDSPEDAVDWFINLPKGADKTGIIEGGLWRVAYESPELAVKLFDSVSDSSRSGWIISQTIQKLAEKDLNKALQVATSLKGSTDSRRQAFNSLLQTWTKIDPDAAFAFAEREPNASTRERLLSNTISQIARFDPKKAIDMAEQLEMGKARSSSMSNALREWAKQSPVEAAAYTQTIEDPFTRDDAYANLLSSWADSDPESAAKLLGTLEPTKALDNAASNIAREWARRDPISAFEWANNLDSPKHRDNAMNRVFNEWAQQDPATAASVLSSNDFGDNEERLASEIARNWANKDLASTLNWATKLTNESSQSNAYSQIARTWAEESPEDTGAWLTALPDGKPRDSAVSSFSSAVFSVDPVNSLGWAMTISDESSRWNSVKRLARDWNNRNPDEASTWVYEQDFSPKQQAELLDLEE